MTRAVNGNAAYSITVSDRRVAVPLAIVAIQFVAAVYFVVDGVDDVLTEVTRGLSFEIVMECLVAFALLGGVVMGSLYIRRITEELRWKDQSLANARGALAEHIALRFAEWGLTPGEGEVALFALKGCDVAEIARLRGAAAGTVRSQLSQIYAKSGVSSQAMLVSLFIEDLLDGGADGRGLNGAAR
jgi:DNA-binding CsgD family transcriptional regulator